MWPVVAADMRVQAAPIMAVLAVALRVPTITARIAAKLVRKQLVVWVVQVVAMHTVL